MTVDDTALQTLQAIFPAHPTSQLQRVLIASGGSVERASAALLGDAPVVSSSSSRGVKRVKINKLDRWLSGKSPEEQPRPSKQTRAKASPSNEGHGAPTASPATTSAFTRLRAPSLPTPQPPPAVNLPPLRLSTPEMIQHHTGGLITLIPSVLPTELASRLYARMVRESEGAAEAGKEPCESSKSIAEVDCSSLCNAAGDRNRWYLFDREVESPHTTSFYVEAPKKEGQYGWNEDGFAEVSLCLMHNRACTSLTLAKYLTGRSSLVQRREACSAHLSSRDGRGARAGGLSGAYCAQLS